MLSRRALLACAVLGIGSWGPSAEAGVARPVALRELVKLSQYAIVGTPVDARSTWEEVDGGRRIVTYTKLRVESSLGAAAAPREVTVRTLGGRVGKIGQVVHGEATLPIGETAVVFLSSRNGALRVAALAQGHYPLRADTSGARRLRVSPQLSQLVGGGPSAVRDLVGRSVQEATELVRRAERQ